MVCNDIRMTGGDDNTGGGNNRMETADDNRRLEMEMDRRGKI